MACGSRNTVEMLPGADPNLAWKDRHTGIDNTAAVILIASADPKVQVRTGRVPGLTAQPNQVAGLKNRALIH